MPKGELFRQIKEMLKGDVNFSLDADEIDGMKVLVGGSRNQVLHYDLQFRSNIDTEIRDAAYSIVMSCHEKYKCRLIVSRESVSGDESKFENSTPTAKIKTDPRNTNISIISDYCIAFDGGVHHAGTPCYNSSEDGKHKKTAFVQLEMISSNKTTLQEVNLSDISGIEKINTICRLFITTWPRGKDSRDTLVTRENLVV